MAACAAVLAALWLIAPHALAPSEPTAENDDVTGRFTAIATTSHEATAAARARAAVTPAPTEAARIALLRARIEQSSLRGAERDGEVRIDQNGRIALDESLRRLFDHFLSLTGEFSPGDIEHLLRDEVERRHGTGIANQVHALFSRYVAMRAELASMALSDDLATRFAQLRAVRRAWFGEDAFSLFADEDRQTAHLLERAAVMHDSGLDPLQRDARLAQLEAARPAALRSAERDTTSALLVEQQTRQFEHLQIDPATRHEERTELWGENAAQRLAALDRDRAQWDRRVADYLRERDSISASLSLTAAARAQAVADLRRRAFDSNEQRRIESLESIGALRDGG